MAKSDISATGQRECKRCGVLFDLPRKPSEAKRRKYCSKGCSLEAIHESMKRPLRDRFWGHVDAGEPDECWPWTRRVDRKGYGLIGGDDGETKLAHRVAYALSKGEIPVGMVVRHSCDNPICCNPSHLLVGTQADNIMDMMRRQRCAAVKIPVEIAWVMRQEFIDGDPCKVIARRHGFTLAAVTHLMKRGRIGHMPPVPDEIRRRNGIRNQVAARTRKIEIDGTVYSSRQAARITLGVCWQTVDRMIRTGAARYV